MGGKTTALLPTSKGITTSSRMQNSAGIPEDQDYLQAIKDGNTKAAEEIINQQGFEKLPDGRLVGYRVARYEDGKAISGADSRQSAELTPGSTVQFPGRGAFVTSKPQHAVDYYAVHDNNVIQKVAFDPADVSSGDLHDKEPEVSVRKAEVLDSEVFADGETPGRINTIPTIAYNAKNEIIPPSQRFHSPAQPLEQLKSLGGIGSSSKMAAPTQQSGGIQTSSNMAPPGGNTPTKPAISTVIPGNISSPTFVKNAQDHGMTPDEWATHLDNLEDQMFELDANNEFALNDADFNKAIGDTVVNNMREQKAQTQQGSLQTLPNTGKVIVIGDLHDQGDNLLAILQDIQDNPDTNLDKNPDVKILFLGDFFSIPKATIGADTTPPLSAGNVAGKAHSEATNRLLTLLMAKYPDQIHGVAGNHDFGILTANLYNNDKTFKLPELTTDQKKAIDNDPNLSPEEKQIKAQLAEKYDELRAKLLLDAQTTSGITTGTMSNNEHAVQKINTTPVAILMGDKAKGEKVRLFIHSALDGDLTPSLDELKNITNPEDILKEKDPLKLATISRLFRGDNTARDPQTIHDTLARLGVDEIYFGHLDPYGLIQKTHDSATKRNVVDKDTDGNYILEVKKTDNIKSPVGAIAGGANLADSQNQNALSGYIVVDLDNDSQSTKLMSDVMQKTGTTPAMQKFINTAQTVVSKAAQDAAKKFGNIMVVDMMR